MNRVVHFEINASDPDKLQKFYTSLFSWEISDAGPDYGGYRIVKTGENKVGMTLTPQNMGINGGLMKRPDGAAGAPGPANAFVCIIGVEDADATYKKALELGGASVMAPSDVPKVGRIAYMTDPDGNRFGIIKPSMEPM